MDCCDVLGQWNRVDESLVQITVHVNGCQGGMEADDNRRYHAFLASADAVLRHSTPREIRIISSGPILFNTFKKRPSTAS
ncbi:hypothetical protein Moror_3942 [Moniliophthora roreri MCA 2997]|uniref:Uncharacterized protein n=1 Tax=Moniliophthora roreri (strain MCA 2997) TaxID=1381753 RepID=V2XRZ5_MONRO|nr:hypothetical protein Moror_3942 [Moniliophthora roreri MCA 2997]